MSTTVSAGLEKSGGAGYGNVKDKMLPAAESSTKLFQHCAMPHTCNIIGAPMVYGQPFVGTDNGPRLLREAGLRGMLTALGWRVEDLPDLDFTNLDVSPASTPFQGKAKNHQYVGAGAKMLADVVEQTIRQGRFPLVLGGDHSVALGSLAGILRARPDTGIVWVDAHADLNTPIISESGNMHGMPVGLLTEGVFDKKDAQSIPGLEWLLECPQLKPEQIVYVGLRDVDPAERKLIRSLGIKALTMYDVDRYGIGNVMEMALQHLLKDHPDRPLHLSYDIDAVDPILAPATGTTVRGGLTFREAHFVAEVLAMSGNLASADIVELNPTLSHDQGAEDTIDLGLQLITSFMGKSII